MSVCAIIAEEKRMGVGGSYREKTKETKTERTTIILYNLTHVNYGMVQ